MLEKTDNDISIETYRSHATLYGFVGNELLTPMNRSGTTAGIDASFWEKMPVPDNSNGIQGWTRLLAYANEAQANARLHANDATVPGLMGASTEYAHLFLGPPRPAADPWETANDPDNNGKVGYGHATVQMRKLIAKEGLELSGVSNQFEDHMGIELLFLAYLCDKAATIMDENGDLAGLNIEMAGYIDRHPAKWMPRLRANVDASRPNGYYSALLEYAHGALIELRAILAGNQPPYQAAAKARTPSAMSSAAMDE